MAALIPTATPSKKESLCQIVLPDSCLSGNFSLSSGICVPGDQQRIWPNSSRQNGSVGRFWQMITATGCLWKATVLRIRDGRECAMTMTDRDPYTGKSGPICGHGTILIVFSASTASLALPNSFRALSKSYSLLWRSSKSYWMLLALHPSGIAASSSERTEQSLRFI
jgi:hypothetical protein